MSEMKRYDINIKESTYPVDEWGRLGGFYSLADVPIAKYIKYDKLSNEDQAKIRRFHELH
tara:strand:+ start:3634 stop:3813 length:180 start_codon:yes stop_codon:yes gene_type:complete